MAVSIKMEKYIFPWTQQLQIAGLYPIETEALVHKIYVKNVLCNIVCGGKNWKLCECPSIVGCLNKLWHIIIPWNLVHTLQRQIKAIQDDFEELVLVMLN